MMMIVFFLSACVATSLLWIGFIISFLNQGQITAGMGYIITLMGLFLPLVVIIMAMALVYTSFEIKRMQLRLNDWIKALKCNVLNDPIAVHEQIGDLVMEKLMEIDDVAYVRYCSVYKEFKDVESFLTQINELLKKKRK